MFARVRHGIWHDQKAGFRKDEAVFKRLYVLQQSVISVTGDIKLWTDGPMLDRLLIAHAIVQFTASPCPRTIAGNSGAQQDESGIIYSLSLVQNTHLVSRFEASPAILYHCSLLNRRIGLLHPRDPG